MSNQNHHNRDNSFEPHSSDDDYDMVTGANPTPRTIPEFITGRPMHPQENLPNPPHIDSPITGPSVQEAIDQNTLLGPINRLAKLLVGMNNKPSAQTLMVRPVITTTLTFDGKSEKFELIEDLFHTMIKMQHDITKTMKNNHFHSLLRKKALQIFHNIHPANSQTLEDNLAVFCRKYVKTESQATAKHNGHRLVFGPNTMKLPEFLA